VAACRERRLTYCALRAAPIARPFVHSTPADNLNKQIAGTDLEGKTLEDIVLASWNGGSPTPAFNNAAQVWGSA
jgi:hypothetical protein